MEVMGIVALICLVAAALGVLQVLAAANLPSGGEAMAGTGVFMAVGGLLGSIAFGAVWLLT